MTVSPFLRIQNFEYCTKPVVGPIQKCSSKCREGGGCCECEVESCYAAYASCNSISLKFTEKKKQDGEMHRSKIAVSSLDCVALMRAIIMTFKDLISRDQLR